MSDDNSNEPTVILCGLPPAQPFSGELPKSGLCGKCNREHLLCPDCGAFVVEEGYGLAGGGVGTYWACDSCDYFMKRQDPDAEASP